MAYVGLDRGIVDHWIYQDAEYFKVWFEMLYRARYSPDPSTELIEGQLVEMKYGEFIFGRIKWSERLKVSERRLRTLVDKLIADNMIHLVKRAPKFSIYCVTNFAKYRQQNDQQETLDTKGFEGYGDHQNDQQATSKRPASDQQATTKEERKNVNKVKKDNKEVKIEYADYVFLTETEHIKLTELLGDDERDRYFLRYASWISGQPAKVQERRSAYLSIMNWQREDQKKQIPFKPRQSNYEQTKNKFDQMLMEEEGRENETFGYHQTGTDPFG